MRGRLALPLASGQGRASPPAGYQHVIRISKMNDLLDWMVPFADSDELGNLVEEALRESMPSGWRASRRHPERLSWTIEPDQEEPGGWDSVEYSLFASPDLSFLVITHDNTDAGALSPKHFIHNAKVIDAGGVKKYGLGGYLQEIFTTCKPNKICVT